MNPVVYVAVMPNPAAPKYRATNWPAYNAALKQRGSLEILFDPGMTWLSAPRSRPGRPMRFLGQSSDHKRAIELCLTLKVQFNLPLRQATGLVASVLKLAEMDWPVPDYTTLCRRQKTLDITPGGRPAQRACTCWSTALAIQDDGGRRMEDA